MRLASMWYFVEIAETKSISKISRKYAIPQQSLSSLLASLENELSMKLFERQGAKLTITEAGQMFYHYCANFFAEYRELQESLHPEKKALTPEKFTITAQNNIAQTLLPGWISHAIKYHPEIQLEVKVQDYADIVQAVLSEAASVGFVLLFEKDGKTYPKLPETLIFTPILYGKPMFWLNKQNPLAAHKSLSLEMLENALIIKDEHADQDLFRFIYEEVFRFNGNFLAACNEQIMYRLVKENIAICPDIKTGQAGYGLGHLFLAQEDIIAMPLSAKNNYKMITGYLAKKEYPPESALGGILIYLQ